MKSRHLTALALCGALTLTACAQQRDGPDFKFHSATKVGTLIPQAKRKIAGPLDVALLNGPGTYRLATQRGHVIVINFWATWCPPCVVETPEFQSIYAQYKSKGVAFVGIDTKDTAAKARTFVSDNDITYTMVSDQEGQTAISLGDLDVNALPFTALVDKQGRIAAVYEGALAIGDLDPVLNQLTAESATSASSSPDDGP